MALYFFSIHGTIYVDDTEGTELPSVDAAFSEATQTARMLLEDGRQIGRNRANWVIRITAAGGDFVGEVRLGDTARAA